MVSIDRSSILFDVIMIECGPRRVEAMAILRRFRPGLTLADAKSLTAHLPACVLTQISLDTVEPVLRAFLSIGARVELAGPHAKDPWVLRTQRDLA